MEERLQQTKTHQFTSTADQKVARALVHVNNLGACTFAATTRLLASFVPGRAQLMCISFTGKLLARLIKEAH